MGHAYTAVQWNRQKMFYDGVLLTGVSLYVGGFIWLTPELDPNAESWNVRMRAYGSAAFILLHIILSIGPLCRLDKRFLPLLYNRRHMGVTMCLLGVLHSRTVVGWYHDFSSTDPVVSLLASNTDFTSFVDFPFELLGGGALLILGLMAATSHDFWLVNLTAPVWKALHMGVYLAYVLLVGHVLLGPLQSNHDPILTGLVVVGALWIVGIHFAAALREKTLDILAQAEPESLVRVGAVSEIPEGGAKVVCLADERVAVFKSEGKVSAISNVCQHQNGPLGEGRIIDGLITCPWHGYQYEPASGASPPPFTERVPTFRVEIRGGVAFIDPKPHPPGTKLEPARIEESVR